MGTIYEFAVDERRSFIDRDEIVDLALRAENLTSTLKSFADVDDHGDGVLRTEILRQIRELANRAIAILS